MTLAHSLGVGGPEIELLMLAGLMFVLGALFHFQKTAGPPVSIGLMLGGLALSVGAVSFGGTPTQDPAAPAGVRIIIDSPRSGQTVPANEPVRLSISIEGGTLTDSTTYTSPTEGHLHIFVDGGLVAMPSSANPVVTLEAGNHRVTVEFTRADHLSFDPRIVAEIELMAI